MNTLDFIPVQQLCTQYEVEMIFFTRLGEIGLLEIHVYEQVDCIHLDKLSDLEKMIRLHQELELNYEGIDIVFNLLHKIDVLQDEVMALKNRLRLYEL